MKRKYTDEQLRLAVQESKNFTQVGRKLGLKEGGPSAYFVKRVRELNLDTSHFVNKKGKYTDDDAAALIPQCPNLRQVLLRLGVNDKAQHSYDRLRRIAKERGIAINSQMCDGVATVSDTAIAAAFEGAISYSEILRKLDIKWGGGTQAMLKKRIQKLGFNISHLAGQGHMLGKEGRNKKTLESILVENSNFSRNALKKRLLKTGLLKYECYMCGSGPEWKNGKEMILVIDHINGINNDNRLENLRIICTPCDSTNPTYGGRNRQIARENRMREIHAPKQPVLSLTLIEPITPKIHRQSKPRPLCIRCTNPCKHLDDKYCSTACYHASTIGVSKPSTHKVPRPSREELAQDIATTPFTKIGRKYGVSDNAVRKWARTYGLSTTSIYPNSPKTS